MKRFRKPTTAEQLQRLARRMEKEFKGHGFAILVWQPGGALNHVTTSRNELAQMMGTQLVVWSQENIAEEDREAALARQAQAAPLARPRH